MAILDVALLHSIDALFNPVDFDGEIALVHSLSREALFSIVRISMNIESATRMRGMLKG